MEPTIPLPSYLSYSPAPHLSPVLSSPGQTSPLPTFPKKLYAQELDLPDASLSLATLGQRRGGGRSGGEEEEGPFPADRAEASYWSLPLVPVFLHFLGGLHVTVGGMCAGRRPREAWASEQTLTCVPYLVA